MFLCKWIFQIKKILSIDNTKKIFTKYSTQDVKERTTTDRTRKLLLAMPESIMPRIF